MIKVISQKAVVDMENMVKVEKDIYLHVFFRYLLFVEGEIRHWNPELFREHDSPIDYLYHLKNVLQGLPDPNNGPLVERKNKSLHAIDSLIEKQATSETISNPWGKA
jgi:hypothetical protein